MFAKNNISMLSIEETDKIDLYPLTYGENKGLSKVKAPDGYHSYNLYKVIKCINKINLDNNK